MRALIGVGLLVGVVAGAWDAVAIVLENPRSFGSPAETGRFAAATLAAYGALGGAAGLLLCALRRATGRPSASSALGAGVVLWLFVWTGVRVHVRWFFGEPLVAPPSLLANAAVAVAAFLVVRLLRRAGRPIVAFAGRRDVAVALGGLVLVAAALAPPRPGGAARAGAERAAPVPGARDVLLVTLDTTRADHLSSFGYPRGTTPFLDRLVRGGSSDVLWAAVPLTNPSHCSMLTGLGPRAHGVLNNGTALPDSVPTVVASLAAEGFHCAAFVSGIPLKAALSGLSPGFDVYDDAFSPAERVHAMLTSLAVLRVADRLLPGDLLERRAEHTVERAIRWLRRAPSPRFLWVHLFDPHTPYRAARPLVDRFGRESAPWTASGRAVTHWPVSDYDAELRGTDRALGRLLRAFAEGSPDGVACVVADHGEGLLQHGELTHGALLYEEDLRVGWIVGPEGAKDPGAEGRLTGRRPARPAADVAAALIALAHGETPPEAGEGPFVAETFPPEGRGRRTSTVGLLPDGRIGKTIVDWERDEAWAFDLVADPGETRPLDAGVPEWAALLPATPDRVAPASLDPEVERRLRELGYVH